jgi:hypothetical protein
MSRRTDQLERMYGVKITKINGYNYTVEFPLIKCFQASLRLFQPVRLHEVRTFLKLYVKELKNIS